MKNLSRKRLSFSKYRRTKKVKKNEIVQHFLKKKKKRRSFLKEKTMSCQNVRIIWKKNSKEDSKTLKNVLSTCETWWKKRERLGRKEGSGDETTLIEVYAQVAVQKTQFLLHMQSGSSQASLEDSIKLSFSFWMVGQNSEKKESWKT